MYASNSSSQLSPISAPIRASAAVFFAPSFCLFSPFFTPISTSRNAEPIRPLQQASNADGSGIYRRKMPTVPKISMEPINITSDLVSFLFSFTEVRLLATLTLM